jgi:hypothetical protein
MIAVLMPQSRRSPRSGGVETRHSNGGPADADRMAGLERDIGQ